MRIVIPPDAPGDGVSDWIYGYTADLSRRTALGWEETHTLFLGMGGGTDETFDRPGYTREMDPFIMLIGFAGTRVVDVKIPPVEPGLYRVTMEFGYDNTEQRPEAVVHDTIRVSN